MQNFITLGQPLLGEKYVAQKRKERRRKIIPNIVDTLFRSNAQGQRTHSARTKIISLNCCLSNKILIEPCGGPIGEHIIFVDPNYPNNKITIQIMIT